MELLEFGGFKTVESIFWGCAEDERCVAVSTLEEVLAGTCWNDGSDPVTVLSEQIAREVVRLMREA